MQNYIFTLATFLETRARQLRERGIPPTDYQINYINRMTQTIRDRAWPPAFDYNGKMLEVMPYHPVARPQLATLGDRISFRYLRDAFAWYTQQKQIDECGDGFGIVHSCCTWCGKSTGSWCDECDINEEEWCRAVCTDCDDHLGMCRTCFGPVQNGWTPPVRRDPIRFNPGTGQDRGVDATEHGLNDDDAIATEPCPDATADRVDAEALPLDRQDRAGQDSSSSDHVDGGAADSGHGAGVLAALRLSDPLP